MKTLKILVAASLTLASFATFAAATPGAGITGTKHDWSAPVSADGTSGGQSLLQYYVKDPVANPTAATSSYVTPWPVIDATSGKQVTVRVQFGLCTKCHTPHKAQSTNLLWNHTLSSNTFTWDQPKTTAGTDYPTFKGDTYKGPTTKCLSCHDGSLSSTDGVWFNRQVVGGAAYVPAAGALDSGHEVGEGGHMAGTHPVAMPYPYMGAANQYNGVANGSQTAFDEFVADPTAIGMRLFNDDGTGNVIAGPEGGMTGMECTSCHDIHNGKRTKDVMLLTGKLAGSATGADGYICNKCHIK